MNALVLFLGITFHKKLDKNPAQYGIKSKYPEFIYENPNLLK
jgi:hypothetical protein